MLQHTSSEVITIQLEININSKIQLNGLGTNEIDWLKTTNNRDKVSRCQRFHLRLALDHG